MRRVNQYEKSLKSDTQMQDWFRLQVATNAINQSNYAKQQQRVPMADSNETAVDTNLNLPDARAATAHFLTQGNGIFCCLARYN